MLHLVKRFVSSLNTQQISEFDDAWIRGVLHADEYALWKVQMNVDRRHSHHIARRFVTLRSHASRDEIAGALLHDVGKIDAQLGVLARVLATVLPLPVARFTMYREHEARGAKKLQLMNCPEATIALVAGTPQSEALRALRQADQI